VGFAVAGYLIRDDSKVGGGTALVGDPQVLGRRFLVAIIELFFVNALFEEEHVGAQLEQRIELGGAQLRPRFSHDGTIGHGAEFNR